MLFNNRIETMTCGSSNLSKKRYIDLQNEFYKLVNNHEIVDALMEKVREVMNYDPNKPTYTQEQADKIKDYRRRMKEEKGVSSYISSGAKAAYYKKKQALNPVH